MIYSDSYAAFAEYNAETDQVKATVQPADENCNLFENFDDGRKTRLLAGAICFAVSLFMPLALACLGFLSLEGACIYLRLSPIIFGITELIFSILYQGGKYRTWHAAEHKAIDAFEQFGSCALEKIKLASRIGRYCGTLDLAVSLVSCAFISAIGCFFEMNPLVVWLIWWGSKFLHLGYLLLGARWLSLILQRYVTTKEPSDIELRTAQAALVALVEAMESGDYLRTPFE